MSNWAQEMFDGAMVEAKRIVEYKKLVNEVRPLASEIAADPIAAAIKMIIMQKEIGDLKAQIEKERIAQAEHDAGESI